MIIVGDFGTPHSLLDNLSRQKLNRETLRLNDIVNQIDLTDLYSTFYPTLKNSLDLHEKQKRQPNIPKS